MDDARKCLECGLPIPAGETGNNCPNCLFRLAFLPAANGRDEAQDSTAPPAAQPHYFAGYELIAELACGGMGVVWKARQLGVNRLVALKMIPTGQLASPQMRLRFRIEIEAVVQLDHPNIVPLYETGEHAGQHYFSMKLLEGGNLHDWTSRHRQGGAAGDEAQSQREAVSLVITIARAVHHAHQRGILHRDLKPSNILLDQEGKPYVADFGLAKVLGHDSGLTLSESAIGSPNYMAPEQAAGHSGQPSVAVDVYGLGAILFELLTGRPPFQGATAVETMRRVVDDEATSPRQWNAALDADLETICLKCLQKAPERRYESAEALAADLERWLGGQPILARPVGPLGQVARWCRRQPALAAAVGLSLLLLLVVVIGTAMAAVRIARAERTATAHLRESLLGQARILRFSSDMGRRAEGLGLVREAAALGGPPEFRRELRHELLSLLTRTEVSFVPQPEFPCSSDPSLNLLAPRGDRFATVNNRHTVLVLDAADGRLQTQFTVPDLIQALECFSGDARFLGIRHERGVTIWDTAAGRECFASNRTNLVFSFVPEKPEVIVQSERKVAEIYELPSGRRIRRMAPYEDVTVRTSWASLSPSPDGRTLAAIRRGSRIVELVDLETGRLRGNLTNEGRAFAAGWSGDSTRLAVSTTARRLILWDIPNGRQLYLTTVLPAISHTVAVNDSASLLAAGGADGVVRFFHRPSPRPSFELAGETARLAFTAGATRLQPLFRNGTRGSVLLERPDSYFDSIVAETDTSPAGCHFSGDGQVVAVGNSTNVSLCAAADGSVLSNLVWSIEASCFDPKEPAVMAAGVPGMFRWALQRHETGDFQLGHERRVLAGPGWRSFRYSPHGDRFVAANIYTNAALLFDRSLERVLGRSGTHPGVDFVTVSPDSRWLATGSEVDRQLRVWDTHQDCEVLAVPGGLRPEAAFSPDGKWLATFGVGFDLLEVESWRRVSLFEDRDRAPVLGGAAFSPDGRLLAVVADVRAIHLIELSSLQVVAILRPTGASQIQALAFSPDQRKLAAASDSLRLCMWDLPVLTRHLRDFGLHWE